MTPFPSIRQTLFSPEGQESLAAMPSPATFPGRMAYARAVCERFQFVDARGLLRESSCIAALRELETAGRITLPPGVAAKPASSRPLMLSTPVPLAVAVPDRVDKVLGLAVPMVTTKAAAHLLARLLQDEHPQGAVQHGGRQLRYLITSDHGVLGGFVFASPALALKPRDRWIGWDPGQRRRHLSQVVGLSRFLIRPLVRCQHLASKAMGLCLRRVPTDFEARYNLRPVLCETFSGADYWGTSLAASGWTYVGRSSGRGRHSRPGQTTTRKGIWLRPLCRDWRTQLGVPATDVVPPPRPRATLAPGDGLAMNRWAQNEFGAAPLHGALVKRLVTSVKIQSMAPSKTFFSAANGDHAAVQGYYRMIERPDTDDVTPDAILATHRERSLGRLRGAQTALLIQDGCDLNFATHGAGADLGVISRTKGSAGTLGIHMHSTFAVNEAGVPLGVPRIEFDCPDGQTDKDKPPEQRKSARWLRGWRDSSKLAAKAPGTRVISVMDREGDIAALFAAYHATGGAELLVRAKHNRVFPDGQKLFDRLRTSPPQATHDLRVDWASARRAARGQKAFAGRDARLAHTEVRWHALALPIPKAEHSRLGTAPAALTAVHVLEPEPPGDVEAVEWLLLTTLPVSNRSEAIEVLNFYALRWRIEDWHRILKSGCEVEKIAHSTAERIKRAVTINAVIGWRLSVLTLLGRVTPEVKALQMFETSEIAVLLDYAGDMKVPLLCQTDPNQPPKMDDVSLGEAVLLIARLGGYLNRKNDAPPGHQVVWNGYFRLSAGAQTLERAIRQGDQSTQKRLLVLKVND
ncbi:MAG: IS4 family transposase [Aestuariivita sp.]|nr:IS4 family transposase [Aestuariivita sp.]MCY4201837.1 IS4 family transposase [Aestuariivita sp.]